MPSLPPNRDRAYSAKLASHRGRRRRLTCTTVAAATPTVAPVAIATTAVAATQAGAAAAASAAVATHAVAARHKGNTHAHQVKEKGTRQ